MPIGRAIAVAIIGVAAACGPSAQVTAAERDSAETVLSKFFKANNESRYSMTSAEYRRVFKDWSHIREIFSKEWYEVSEFKSIRKHESKPLVFVELVVNWRFEGYKGQQTCHFELAEEARELRINWFLC